jgi:hypothetical protein
MKKTAVILLIVSVLQLVSADTYIRYNNAGYTPNRPKSLAVISSTDLAGEPWTIKNASSTILSGNISQSITGKGAHTSHPFNYVIDFSSLTVPGEYVFQTKNKYAAIKVSKHPYNALITDALRHLKTTRSGTSKTLNHRMSHLKDSAAIVKTIDGDPVNGKWIETSPRKTVDALGGWYDAGDYIKFTLTIATTVYYLLEAWESNPKAFTKVLSDSDLPDILDETKFGLDYLCKMYVQPDDLFIIQVGDGKDHNESLRMPENDALDGKRPALCAISPVHMGITAAALAKGARVFRSLNRISDAYTYQSKASAILTRANQSDALKVSAFEKNETNDFYRDNGLTDNMALGSIELFKTTHDSTYLKLAQSLKPAASGWVGWGTYNFSANFLLSEFDSSAKKRAEDDVLTFIDNMDVIWGIPLSYTWASLLAWNGAGGVSGAWNARYNNKSAEQLHYKMTDLLFGRNNWGLSFLASPRLTNTITKIYSQIYTVSDIFPLGAVSLGPGDRQTHSQLEQYFGKPPASNLDSFQTNNAIYHDWEKDFMLTETVTMSQAYALWMIALACDKTEQAPADSTIPDTSPIAVFDSTWRLPMNSASWYIYNDETDSGKSIAEWKDLTNHTAQLTPKTGAKYPYTGFGFTIPTVHQNLSAFTGVLIYGNFEDGASFRCNFAMEQITDYDYHGKTALGKGQTKISINFKDLAQQNFGKPMAFNASSVIKFDIVYTSTVKSGSFRIDSLVFFRKNADVVPVTRKHAVREHPQIIRKGRTFIWNGMSPVTIELRDLLGRTIWKSFVTSGKSYILPRYNGMCLLTSNKKVLHYFANLR